MYQETHEDSSSVDSDDVVDGNAACSRPKRELEWCGVDTEVRNDFKQQKIIWPPPSPSAAGTETWRHLHPVRPNVPLHGNKMQLFSKTNYNLAVYADGSVRGTRDDTDLHSLLEIITAGIPGHVRIQGILTKLFVAMDGRGRLYGEPNMSEEGTVFIESFQGSYNSYLSRKFSHMGWYLGIKKSGKFKNGSKTTYRQKAVLFLPRRSKFAFENAYNM